MDNEFDLVLLAMELSAIFSEHEFNMMLTEDPYGYEVIHFSLNKYHHVLVKTEEIVQPDCTVERVCKYVENTFIKLLEAHNEGA